MINLELPFALQQLEIDEPYKGKLFSLLLKFSPTFFKSNGVASFLNLPYNS